MAPKRNGFWYFMADFKKQAEAAGRTFPGGFRDVQSDPECSQQWRLLTDQEKKKYNARAKREYGNRPKLTCWGESIAEVEAREKRRAEYEENMKRDIAETINLAVLSKTIAETPFYFIHANYFYAKEDADTTLHYVPAEMAICEFSMSAGCKRFYHQIIKIDVELGYARETMEHAEQTHKLPPDYAGGEKDYKVILRKFQEFLEPERIRTGKMPPVYSSRKHKPVVNDFLERLAKTASAPDWTGHQEVPNLYTLEILFGKLMVASNAELMMYLCNPTILAECELDKGAFAYTPNIECTYHQRIEETSIYCSLGIIRQWVFLICDYCCHRMGIKMIKEVHCPANAATDDIEILVTHMADLGLKKEHKSGSVKSATGVTQAYREAKAGRTAHDEERRRIAALKAPPLTIIDHGQLLQPASSMSSLTSSISESCQLGYLKPLRVPKTLATVVKNQESPPSINPDNFPPINSRKLFGSRLLAGRGRGGVPAGN